MGPPANHLRPSTSTRAVTMKKDKSHIREIGAFLKEGLDKLEDR